MLFISNVFNMMDWSINGVDPCTGIYIHNVVIANIVSNNTLGPNFPINIRFNQFNNRDYGFGDGWELCLTRIEDDPDRGRFLYLADGCKYKIENDEVCGNVPLQYKRTNTFRCEKLDESTYKVYYKDGLVELIENGLVTKITNPNGQYITFSWLDDRRLKLIADKNRDLVRITYEEDSPTFHYVSVELVSIGRVDDYLIESEDGFSRLANISSICGSINNNIWEFQYKIHNDNYLCLTNISSQHNNNSEVRVSYGSLAKPNGLVESIPYANQLEIFNGEITQPDEFYVLKYSEVGAEEGEITNYLGAGPGGVEEWDYYNDNLDNIADEYRFGMIEVQGDQKTSIRTYNKFYLLCAEVVESPINVSLGNQGTYYDYSTRAGEGISGQTASFDCPVKKTTRFQVDGRLRTGEEATFAYDDFSNIVESVGGDGIKEVFEYYPIEGDDAHCPPDPCGFVRYVKNKTIYPRSASKGAAPVKQYQYEYGGVTKNGFVVLTKILLSDISGEFPSTLCCSEYHYDNDSDITPGEITQVIESVYSSDDKSSVAARYETATYYSREVLGDSESIKIDERVVGYDDVQCVTSKRYSLGANLLVEEIDQNGISTTYDFDCFGRPTKKTFAPGTDFETFEILTYKASLNSREIVRSTVDFVEIETYNKVGLPAFREFRVPTEGGVKCYTVDVFKYDSLGRKIYEAKCDQALDLSVVIKEETSYSWNAFGDLISCQNPDNSNEILEYDYIENTLTVTAKPGNSVVKSTFDEFGLLSDRKTYMANSDDPVIVESFRYDGLNRQVSCERTGNEATRYEYDEFDRIVTEEGDLSGRKSLSYAQHTIATLQESVSIDGVSVSQTRYDGLDRRICSTTNGVAKIFDYQGSSSWNYPKKVSIVNGRSFVFEYSAQLDKPLVRRSSGTSQAPHDSLVRRFSYDLRGGSLNKSTSEVQFSDVGYPISINSDFEYDLFNNESRKKVTFVQQDKDPFTLQDQVLVSTTAGRHLSLVSRDTGGDVSGELRRYNSNGSLSRVEFSVYGSPQASGDYTYGADGQLQSVLLTSKSLGEGSVVVERSFVYDDLARVAEIWYRLVTPSNPSTLDKKTPIARLLFEYNSLNLIANVSYGFFNSGNNLSATEMYEYDGRGILKKWSRDKDGILCVDGFGNRIVSQDFDVNVFGELKSVETTFDDGVTNVMSYFYDNQGAPTQLSKITNTAVDKGYPEEILLSYDVEGNALSEMKKGVSPINQYAHGWEDNVVQIVNSDPSGAACSQTFWYDASGQQVIKVQKPENQSPVTYVQNISDGNINLEYHAGESGWVPIIYHRLGNEITFISGLDESKNPVTGLSLNLFDGTPIARAWPYNNDGKQGFYIQVAGQNPYGFAFNIQAYRLPFPVQEIEMNAMNEER